MGEKEVQRETKEEFIAIFQNINKHPSVLGHRKQVVESPRPGEHMCWISKRFTFGMELLETKCGKN